MKYVSTNNFQKFIRKSLIQHSLLQYYNHHITSARRKAGEKQNNPGSIDISVVHKIQT